jgi:hypothetical protein
LTAKLTVIVHVKPLHRTIHRNNENAQEEARRALVTLEGTESEREKGRKSSTYVLRSITVPTLTLFFPSLWIALLLISMGDKAEKMQPVSGLFFHVATDVATSRHLSGDS